MDRDPKFDLLLLGYRNDLAREQTLRCLDDLPPRLAGPIRLDREVPLPHVLCGAIEHEVGLELAAKLRASGAHVRLAASLEGSPEAASHEPSESLTPASNRRPSSLPVLLFLMAFAVFLVLREQSVRKVGPAERRGDGPVAALRPLLESPLQRRNNEAVSLNAAGDYAAAAEEMRIAVRSNPEEQVLRRNLRVVLRNWAVAELNAGRPDEAVKLLYEALAEGEDAQILAALGVAHVSMGAWPEARDALERAVELGARDAGALLALGKVYRQQGERGKAVEMFQRARESGATGGDFDQMLARLERELDAEWDFAERRSAHFEISFDSGEDRLVVPIVLDSLERAYFVVGRRFDWYPDERVQAVLYPEADFHDVTQSPDWAAGVFDGRIKLPVRGLREGDQAIDRTLLHEYTHVVIAQIARGRCPTWINEGLAIWMEEKHDGDREDWAWQQISGQRLFTLRGLQRPFLELPADRARVAYAQSYLAVRILLDRFDEYRMRQLLASLGSGRSLEAAFDEVLLTPLALFEEDLFRRLSE